MTWAYLNSAFIEEENARLQVGDLALQRGYGAFDFFRVVDNKPLFLEDYLDRFFNSIQDLFIPAAFSRKVLNQILLELLSKNNLEQSGVRMILTGGYAPDSYTPVTGNLIIQQHPIVLPNAEKVEKGIRIMTHAYQRDLPTVKSINYLMGIWLQKQLVEKGFEDVLYYQDHSISEFPRANVFMITKDHKLITPHRNILLGITRKQVIQLAQRTMQVEERNITRDELLTASEIFMTSTTKRILPITNVDGHTIGTGLAGHQTLAIRDAFIQLENQWTRSQHPSL